MVTRDQPAAARPASPLRHPVRLLALVGVIGVVVGVFGPWVQGTLPDGSVTTYNGFAGAADGVLQLVFCAALVLLMRSRTAGESQTLVVQLLPAGAGLACLAYAIVAWRTLDQFEILLADKDAVPVVGWGIQTDLIGTALLVAGAVGTTALVMRTHPRRPRAAADAPVLDRRALATVGGYLLGVFGGGALGVVAGLAVLGSTANAVIVFFVGIGALVGWLGADTVRRVSRDWGSLDER
ncbi:MAG TPA: hypothetical protein VMH24_01625 [Candidatus Sulfotelmatobacter sp.]|nr:hypothetical protein [Candidatus Sulfotelmatobacter sp.]